MSRASTRTLLSLDEWARIMGFNPLHFNGIQIPDLAPANTCGSPIMQYAWQQVDGVSREDIATAIADAEERIAQYTRFKLLPTYELDERHPWARPTGPEYSNWGFRNVHGQWATVHTDWGHVISGGVQGLSRIESSAAVTYTDTDGDGYKETATVSVTSTVTDANEIAVFLPNENGEREFEIRPLRVTIVGDGTITIRMRREQLVNPGLVESLVSNRAINGTDDNSFTTTVDVYRQFIDPSQQAQMLWENQPNTCNCGNSGCVSCYMSTQFGCTLVRDYRTGIVAVSPALWNVDTQAYQFVSAYVASAPDRVRLWYLAGWRDHSRPRPSCEMDPKYARAVAYFATSLLARPMCSCQNVTAAVEMWQDDLAQLKFTNGNSENFQLDRASLSNPFGTTRGAMYAWKLFQRAPIGEAVAL